jgi:hypothetical protein
VFFGDSKQWPSEPESLWVLGTSLQLSERKLAVAQCNGIPRYAMGLTEPAIGVMLAGNGVAIMTGRSRPKPATVEDVEGWLNELCGMPPRICPECGSAMMIRSATFSWPEGIKSWTVPLPICLKCDPSFSLPVTRIA